MMPVELSTFFFSFYTVRVELEGGIFKLVKLVVIFFFLENIWKRRLICIFKIFFYYFFIF
jgi:hypothetical protein